MRLPSPKLATFQRKQIMLTYLLMFLIGYTLFGVDLHLQGRT